MQRLPTFESRNPFTTTGYSCTNEEPERFRELLNRKVFKRVLSICSGGEVPLLVLLPRTTQEVVAVDHSKRSLLATYLKILVLNRYGPVEGKDILTTLATATSVEKLKKVAGDVPEGMKIPSSYPEGSYHRVLTNDYGTVAREWQLARLPDLKATIKKLHLLKLVHGDLTDVTQDPSPFELLYFSNAFEHTDRNGKSPDPRKIEKLVMPGGFILTASGSGELENYDWCQYPKKVLGWEKLAAIPGKRASWSAYGLYQTRYGLYRTPGGVCSVCGSTCEAVARKARVGRVVVR